MKTRTNPIIIIVSLVLVLFAGTAFILLQKKNPNDERGTISGNIVDAKSNTQLKGVTVTGVDKDGVRYVQHEYCDTTGSDGYFSMELPPNEYTLEFEADGYEPFSSTSSYEVKKNKQEVSGK